jgi:hypothetical protein
MSCPRRCRARPELGERSSADGGCRVQGMPRQTGKWNVELLVVLVRVKGKALRPGQASSTAAMWWRPMGGRVPVAGARGDTEERLVRWEGPQATRGHAQEQEVVLGKPCRRWAAATDAEQRRSGARQRKNRGARGGRR